MSRAAQPGDVQPLDFVKEAVILTLWRQGFSTLDIANKIGCREFQVYNKLLHLRES